MSRKHIFIGMGGSGTSTIANVKYKIYERTKGTKFKSRLDEMKDNNRFIFIDTDAGDLDKLNQIYKDRFEAGREKMISRDELVNLGTQNPYVIYQKAKDHQEIQINRRIVESCDAEVAERMDNRALKFGAGAFRLKSRTAFARMANEFCDKLRADIRDLSTVESNAAESNTICYWVVGSCAGGTGSGIINDVLYFVNMVHKSVVDEADPKVTLLLYMPQFYIDVNAQNPKYPNNAFAVMNELETFQVWSKHSDTNKLFHRFALVNDYKLVNDKLPYRPFECCIPIDFQTETGNNMGELTNMYSNTAELLFYVHDGEGAAGFESFMDNNRDGARSDKEDKCFLLPMGYVSLKKPEEDFRNYMRLRLQYELLEYGLLGEEVKEDEVNKECDELFEQTLNKYIFKPSDERSFFAVALNAQKHQKTKGSLNASIIQKEHNNSTAEKLPENVSIQTAETAFLKVKQELDVKKEVKNMTAMWVKHDLWAKAEDLVHHFGVLHAIQVINQFDKKCQELWDAYDSNTKTESLAKYKLLSKQASQEQVDKLTTEEKVKKEKTERTIGEIVGSVIGQGNKEDIEDYYKHLIKFFDAKVNQYINEQAFEIVKELCYGDNGVLDTIRKQLEGIREHATNLRDSQEGPRESYRAMAQKCLDSRADVTTVYLPDICEFVDGNGWKEGNLFSKWYSSIITPGHEVVNGLGMAPERESMTKVFDKMFNIDECCKLMRESQYLQFFKLDEQDKDTKAVEEHRLFTNTEVRPDKAVEDILHFTAITMEKLCNEDNGDIKKWNHSTLPSLYNGLTVEQRDQLTKRLNPSLFFSYNTSKLDGVLEQREFCVAANIELAKQIFHYAGRNNQKFISTKDSNLMYILSAKLGLSFDYYRTYDFIKTEYEKCTQKEYYHFHQAFAECGGDPSRIKLPKDPDIKLIPFLKYLLMDEFSRDQEFASMIFVPEDHEKMRYSVTPIRKDGFDLKLATLDSLQFVDKHPSLLIDGKRAGIVDTLKGNHLEVVELYEIFSTHFTTGHMERFVNSFINGVAEYDEKVLKQHFPGIRAQLYKTMCDLFNDSKTSKYDKDVLTDMLDALKYQLDTYEHFLA